MNVLEWKFESPTLTVKAEDMEDGLVAIYTIKFEFQGFAASLEKGNFQTEESWLSLNKPLHCPHNETYH